MAGTGELRAENQFSAPRPYALDRTVKERQEPNHYQHAT